MGKKIEQNVVVIGPPKEKLVKRNLSFFNSNTLEKYRDKSSVGNGATTILRPPFRFLKF